MAAKKSQRVTLDLGENSAQRIERLLGVLDARTTVDVIRQALKLLEFHVSQEQRDKEVLLRDKATGQIEKITILDLVPEAQTRSS